MLGLAQAYAVEPKSKAPCRDLGFWSKDCADCCNLKNSSKHLHRNKQYKVKKLALSILSK